MQQVTFEVSKIHNKRDSYLPEYSLLEGEPVNNPNVGITPDEYWTHKINLGLRYNFYRTGKYKLYWDQNVVGYSTNVQYRRMYWDWEFGQTMFNRMDLFWHHRSEHGLETATEAKYPLEDIIGIRVYLYKK